MNDFIPIGSNRHFYSPIKSLINASQEIYKKYISSQDPNIQQLLKLIPVIDPFRQEMFLNEIKSTNFILTLQKFGYKGVFDLNQFLNPNSFNNCQDIEIILIFVYCIFWSLNSIEQNNFADVLNLLKRTKDSKFAIIHNFCFELILNRAISLATQKDSYNDFCQLFLNYILSIQNLPETSFYLLITFFNVVSECGTDNNKAQLKNVIEHIFICNFDCLKGNDFSLLLNILRFDLNEFDNQSLLILGLVTKYGKASPAIIEIVHNLYKTFIQLILDSKGLQKANFEKSTHIIYSKKPSQIPKHNYKFYSRKKTFQFKHVPYELVSLNYENFHKKILNDDIYTKTINLADFLVHASNEITIDFIAYFSKLFHQEENFIEYCYVFLEILIIVADSKLVPTIIDVLLQNILFSPNFSIFDTISPEINYLRNKTFELISLTDPPQISIVICAAQHYPYLLNEHFMRILTKFEAFDPLIFSFEPIRTILVYSSLAAQQLFEESAYGADMLRSVNFAFISSIICHDNSCDSLFMSSFFVKVFFSYIFEPGLSNVIFSAFEKVVSILSPKVANKYANNIINFYQEFVNSALEETNNPKYHETVQLAFNSLISGIQYNINLASHFVILFDLLLKYTNHYLTILKMRGFKKNENPNNASYIEQIDLILICLKFFKLLSFTVPYCSLGPTQFSILYKAINNACGAEPDQKIIDALFYCLDIATFIHSTQGILICFPSVLPLLMLIQVNSPTLFHNLVNIFLNLCDFSRSNIIALHDGFIDLLLIQYLTQNKDNATIQFGDQHITFNVNREKSLDGILNLLSRIINEKSDYSIAVNLINLLISVNQNSSKKNILFSENLNKFESSDAQISIYEEKITQFVLNLLLNGASEINRITKIPLDTSEPFLSIENFNWTSIKKFFVLDFNLILDEMISCRFKCSFTLFRVTDNVNTFSIVIKNGIIHAQFKTPEKTSSALLFRNIFHAKWAHFTIFVFSSSDKTKLFNYMNKERISDSFLDTITMNGPVTMYLGGSDFDINSMPHPCFGYIFDFKFFPFRITDEEIDLLAENSNMLTRRPLFSTSLIHTEMTKTISIPQTLSDDSSSAVSPPSSPSSRRKIKMKLLSTFHRKWHILDYFCEEGYFQPLINDVRLDVALDILYFIFTKHVGMQTLFIEYIDTLFNQVLNNVSYKLYISLFRIMGILENEQLKLLWFEKFIINVVLWSTCDEFVLILNHWQLSLKQYRNYFVTKNYFNELLTQFMIRFGVSDDTSVRTDPEKPKKELETMKTFCRFMVKVSELNFDSESFDILLSCILVCDDESNLWDLVRILYSVSGKPESLKSITKQKLQFLHKLFLYQNHQLTALATYCLHNLSLNVKDYDLFAISYTIIGYHDLETLVDKLLQNFQVFPDILSLLTVLSIQTNRSEKLAKLIGEGMTLDVVKIGAGSYKRSLFSITRRSYWYIWPILLMMNVSDAYCDILCTFLALCITNLKANQNNCIDQIFALLFRISYMKPSIDIISRVLHHLYSSYSLKEETIPDYISKYCFIFFFIHMPDQIHSRPLLNLCNNFDEFFDLNKNRMNTISNKGYNINNKTTTSMFPDLSHTEFYQNTPLPTGMTRSKSGSKTIFNIFELESLLACELFDFHLICRVNIEFSQKIQLTDSFFAELYMNLDNSNPPSLKRKIIQYFYDKSSLDSQTQFYVASNLFVFLNNFMNDTSKLIYGNLKSLKEGIIELLESSRKCVSAYKSDEARHLTHLFLSSASSELQKNTPKCDKSRSTNIKLRKRSNQLCTLLFPFKYKVVEKKAKPKDNNNIYYELNDLSGNSSIAVVNNSSSEIPGIPPNFVTNMPCLISHFQSGISNKIGKLFLYDNKFVFSYKEKVKLIKFSMVRYLLPRKVEHNIGYEIYTNNNKSLLFFVSAGECTAITSYMKLYQFCNAESIVFHGDTPNVSNLTNDWLNYRISNFEYLIKLNIFAGRSFNQYRVYPIMPSILSNFNDFQSSQKLDNHKLKVYSQPSSYQDDFFDTYFLNTTSQYTDYLTISADFYFDFGFNNNKSQKSIEMNLPKWAKNRFDFIYNNRKKLELIDISPFIDRVFGYKKESPNTFIHLFARQHPKRAPLPLNNIPKEMKVYDMNQKIASVVILLRQNSKILFWLILEDKKIYNAQLDNGVFTIKCCSELNCPDEPIISYSFHHIFAYSRKKAVLYYISSLNKVTEIPLYTELPLFTTLNRMILFCRDKCSLCKMGIDGKNYSKFCFSESKVTALISSKHFSIIAYATMDGYVHICDLETAKEINRQFVGYQAKQIAITSNLGFIISISDTKLNVFTVNGESITSASYNFLISQIYLFSLKTGQDFISFVTNKNEVGYFEAFYPEKYKFLKQFNSSIKRVSYDPIHFVFIIVESDGRIDIIPQTINVI